MGRHPSTEHVRRYFAYEHLKTPQRGISAACAALAGTMIESLPDGPELTVGLRKLLEAKDCFVRASLELAQEAAPTQPTWREERDG